MSKSDKRSRGEKIWEDFLDTGTDTVTNWGIDAIRENLPKIMDGIVNKSREIISTSVDDEKGKEVILQINHDTFLKGIECGEKRKELALIWAMGKSGFNKMQIQQVLEQAQQAWEPID